MTDTSVFQDDGGTPNVRHKVLSLDDLAGVSADARGKGRRVAMAHGVFDLMHLGHVRHLEQARRHGDLLIVTITPDRFVNKGPGRPVFGEALRAEMLAAMEYVDYVGINDHPSAEGLIRRIRPHAYVKGSDYSVAADDVTGKIDAERAAVEDGGGRLVFTDDIVFSSSTLINRHLNLFEPEVQRHVETIREEVGLDRLLDLIDRLQTMRVLVVGDVIVDEYRYVMPLGQASKENIIATRFVDSERFAGGVIAAANHVAGLCREVDVLTVLGDSHEQLVRDSLVENANLLPIRREGVPTTAKIRYVEQGYMRKLFEVQEIDDTPLASDLSDRLNRIIAEKAADYDLVIVADFGHGMLGPSTVDALGEHSRFLAVNAQTNSANRGFNLITKYSKADYVCIDLPEARLAVADKFVDPEHLVSDLMPKSIDCPLISVTRGRDGCVTWSRKEGTHQIPAFTRQVIDTMGAGDAFFVVSAPLAAVGAGVREIGFVGNVAGAIKVGIVGHRKSVERSALIKAVTGMLK